MHPLLPEDTPQKRAARAETFIMEFTLDRDDGTRRYFEATGQPIHGVGDATFGGVLAIRDITERSLHRFQDEFLAVASHELRTPLTPLQAYLQLLSKLLSSEPEPTENTIQARNYLARALNQVRHLRRLVQDIVDVRRLQQGGFRLEMERITLDQVVRQCVTEAQMAAPEGQAIELETAKTALEVEADPLRLQQVIMNLLANAITYAPHSPRIQVRLYRNGNEAVVEVLDTGPEILAADLPHIFARFYQSASSEEKPSRRGLGLGLYIAHELVAEHGGRLTVSSVMAPSPEHGSTFTVHLPLAPGSMVRKR